MSNANLPKSWDFNPFWNNERETALAFLRKGIPQAEISDLPAGNYLFRAQNEHKIFPHLPCNSSTFVQAIHQFAKNSGPAQQKIKEAIEKGEISEKDNPKWSPNPAQFVVGEIAEWMAHGLSSGETSLQINDEMLKIGCLVPFLHGRRVAGLYGITPYANLWVLGPDKDDLYLSMDYKGPRRQSLDMWKRSCAEGMVVHAKSILRALPTDPGAHLLIEVGKALEDPMLWKHFTTYPQEVMTRPAGPLQRPRMDHCRHCGKAEAQYVCGCCHGGVRFCNKSCLEEARREGKLDTCALIPESWDVAFSWFTEEGQMSKRAQEAGAKLEKVANETRFLFRDFKGDKADAYFKDVRTDCSLFLQMIHKFSLNGGKRPEDFEICLGGHSSWISYGTDAFFGNIKVLTGPKEELQVGYMYPVDSQGKRYEFIRNFTAGNGMWVLGPDANGRYLGMGQIGPQRLKFEEWAEFLCDTIDEDGGKCRVKELGSLMRISSLMARGPGRWKITRGMAGQIDETANEEPPAP